MNDYRDLADGMLAEAAAAFLSATAAHVHVLVYFVVVPLGVLGVGLVLTATFGRGSTRSQAYQVLRLLRPSSIRVPWLQMTWSSDPPHPPPDPPFSGDDPAGAESPQG